MKFITSRVLCANCGKPFKEGDRILTTSIGLVRKIGGLGLYKDELIVHPEETSHHEPKCPNAKN